MLRSAYSFFLASLFFGLCFFGFLKPAFAETTSFRSAQTITTIGNPSYINLGNCSTTDGLACNRESATSFADLDLRNFGDFGIPDGALITHVRIRVTGKVISPTLAPFVAISRVNSQGEFYESCQSPGDLWRMTVLKSSVITTYNVVTPFTNGYLDECLTLSNINTNNFIFRIHYANGSPWSANIDNFEIAFDYTPAPTPTPSPTPAPPAPFLDLPWDYEAKGLSFNDAALSINSFFDHEYPLLSAGLNEPSETQSSIIFYREGARDFDSDYSSHDGYDYGRLAKANFGDPVRAADSGIATFINACGACGNAIHIDHGNGYQTRYYHLQNDGLITQMPGQEIEVNRGDQIGKVGTEGNCQPKEYPGDIRCAHIHFMVVQDKNHDGDFEDNIPDGLVDPFGWQSEDPDPWESYEFFYKGENRTGNKSYYLWSKQLDNLNAILTSNGGVFTSGRSTVTFPGNATSENVLLRLLSSPSQKLSELIKSIGPSVIITVTDSLGNPITSFNYPFVLAMDFAGQDISNFVTDTLSIYSSTDGVNWQKENTNIDLENFKATTEVNHLTYFALMGERLDTIPATTTAVLSGNEGRDNWFRSDVIISFLTEDNPGGLGVDYTLYKLDEGDWQEYTGPIELNDEREHMLKFYSVDNDENIEDIKSMVFRIDKTPPEAEIQFNPTTLDIDILGYDGTESASINTYELPKKKTGIDISDEAGNILMLTGKNKEKGRDARIAIESLQYNDSESIDIDPTSLAIAYKLDENKLDLRKLIQSFVIKGEMKIKLVYSEKTGVTQVITKIKGQEKIKEELFGMKLLKITTDKGTLNYSY